MIPRTASTAPRGARNDFRRSRVVMMLSVAVRDTTNKSGHNNLWTLAPHRQHCIIEHAIMSPARERFLLRLRETKVRFGSP